MAKLNERCFCYLTAAMFVSFRGAQTWQLHTKLHKFAWNTSPNKGRMKNCSELNLGKVVYTSIIFHIPASWLNLLNGYDFYFWWRDTANQPLSFRKIRLSHQKGTVLRMTSKSHLLNVPYLLNKNVESIRTVLNRKKKLCISCFPLNGQTPLLPPPLRWIALAKARAKTVFGHLNLFVMIFPAWASLVS